MEKKEKQLVQVEIKYSAMGVTEFLLPPNISQEELTDMVFEAIRSGDFKLYSITLSKMTTKEVK